MLITSSITNSAVFKEQVQAGEIELSIWYWFEFFTFIKSISNLPVKLLNNWALMPGVYQLKFLESSLKEVNFCAEFIMLCLKRLLNSWKARSLYPKLLLKNSLNWFINI